VAIEAPITAPPAMRISKLSFIRAPLSDTIQA
jgi:hypothetical protein